jgi:hypothetical protein
MTVHEHRALAAYSERCQDKAALAIKRVSALAIARVNEALLHERYRVSDGAIKAAFAGSQVAADIVALAKDYATRPAMKAREVYDAYIAGIAERAGIVKKNAAREYPATMFSETKTTEEYIAKFYDNFDLSGLIWKDIDVQQDKILAIIRGGIAQGRDPVDIARDLEVFLKYHDGGKRVLGRWRNMIPPGREAEALAEKADHMIAIGVMAPQDKAPWIERSLITATHRPYQVSQYARRVGSAGLDYRVIRVVRTETQFFLQEEQKQIASDPITATGKARWILDAAHRDYRCKCAEYAKGIVGGVQVGTPDGIYDVDTLPKPPHPNCLCVFKPVLKSMDAIYAALKEKYT